MVIIVATASDETSSRLETVAAQRRAKKGSSVHDDLVMASRSFKPASYLASAAQRPPFTRSSSSSSARSEESIFKSFPIDEKKENTNTSSPGPTSSASRSYFDENTVTTPGRKGSAPIAIELPGRDPRAVYTPLSARGDLPGGYFPNHEEITRSYKSHPFHNHHDTKATAFPDSPFAMSAVSTPTMESTLRGPQSILSPGFPPEVLTMPMGKYHPSNFVSQPSSAASTPTVTVPAPFPSNNLTIPKATNKRPASRPAHERRGSDVKRKIQQYQRDLIAQARIAGMSSGTVPKTLKEPNSPKLLPLGSPGPITPFELEESEGYLVAGSVHAATSRGLDAERQRNRDLDFVGRMIEAEEERARGPRTKI